MRRLEIRPEARADLADIARYTDAQWGREQTRTYLAEVADAIDRIVANPMTGSDQGHVSPGLRKRQSGRHNIYYRYDTEIVKISRVMHQRMNVSSEIQEL